MSRNVGGQHDPALRTGLEDTILVVCRQPGIQGEQFGGAVLALFQCQVGVAYLALARQEHQDVAVWILARYLVNRSDDRIAGGPLAVLLALAFGRAVAGLTRETPPSTLTTGAPPKCAEKRSVSYGRRGDE